MRKDRNLITGVKYGFNANLGIILLLYAIFILAITFPTILSLNKTVLGDQYTDTWNALWGIHYVKDNILSGKSLFFTNDVFYPQGGYFYPINLINAILILPVYLFLSLPASYNLMVIILMLIAAIGMYKLTLYIIKSKIAAFYAGLCYIITPVVTSTIHNGTDEFLGLCWVPFYILSLFKIKDKSTPGVLLSSMLFLFLATVSSWYIGFSLGIFTGFFLIYIRDKKTVIKNVIRIVAVTTILCAPFFGIFFKSVTNENKVIGIKNKKSVEWALKNINSTDLSTYFKINPFWGKSRNELSKSDLLSSRAPQDGYFVHNMYIGVIILILSILGLMIRSRAPDKVFWIICAMFFFLLSLGPYPRINGLRLENPFLLKVLPYSVINHILPLSSYVSLPFRFSLLMYISLFILASIGLTELLKRANKKYRLVLVVSITACTIFEYLFIAPVPYPYRHCKTTVPDFVLKLKKQPGIAIIEVPVDNFIYRVLRPGLYYQAYHKKKVIYSLDAFEGISPALKDNLFMNYLDRFSRLNLIEVNNSDSEIGKTLAINEFILNGYKNATTEGTATYKKIASAIKDLKTMSFSYLVVYKDLLSHQIGKMLSRFLQKHIGKPYWVSDKVAVYKL